MLYKLNDIVWSNEPNILDMDEPEKQRFNMARDREMGEFRLWWVKEMLETPSPQTERLVLFWHNHFVSTYPALDEQSTSLARQNLMFRRQGSRNFRLVFCIMFMGAIQ